MALNAALLRMPELAVAPDGRGYSSSGLSRLLGPSAPRRELATNERDRITLIRGVELTHLEYEGWALPAVSRKKEAPSGTNRGFFGSFREE